MNKKTRRPLFSQQSVAILHLDSGTGTQSPDFKSPWIQFPYWTFSYCLTGKGRTVFKETGESYFSREGRVSIAPANCAHMGKVISENSGIYHWIHVQLEIFGFRDPLAYLTMPHVLSKKISMEILDIGQAIVGNKSLSTHEAAINHNYQGIRLLKLLSDNFKWVGNPELPSAESERLTPALELMKSNLKKVNISDLARAASMSASSFHRHFKKTFGVTPYAYVEKLRMREADNSLSRENISIDELATCLGYCDRFQFSKVFKRFYGLGPSQYRKNYQSLFSS